MFKRSISAILAMILLLGLIPMAVAAPPSGPNVINVVEAHGADPTGVQDACEAVKNALAAAKKLPEGENKTVYFPQGEYHFYADYAQKKELYISNTLGLNQSYKVKNIGILLEGMKNVTIDGGGSMFIYHGDITSFAAIDCENITFTNFSFDHASPSVVDMTVESKVEGENAVIFSVPACYDYTINGASIQWRGEVGPVTGNPYWQGSGNLQHGQIYDTLSGKCWSSGGPFDNVTGITDQGEGRLKFTYNSSGNVPQVGYSYQRRNTTRTTAAVLIWQSTGVTMKNINAHYLHGFGIVGQLSKDITLQNVSFRARPESGRTTASFADFVQMSSVGGKVTIKDCDFSAAHDDPINIHGTFLTVERVSADGKTLTVKYRHNETAGFPQFYVGDTVDFSTKGTMVPLADSTRTIAAVKDNGWGKDTMTIVLNESVTGLTGNAQYVIENVTYTPEVEITGCRFTSIPTRGILVTTRKPVRIENNLFDAMNMASIYISCDAQGWYESGHTESVTIRNNTFLRPGSACIFVEPTGGNDQSHQLHSNMTIEDNTFFLERSVQVVNAKSVRNLTIRNNSVMRYQPDVTLTLTGKMSVTVGETAMLTANGSGAELGSQLYRFENCKEVKLENNRYDGGLNQKIELTAGTQQNDLTIIRDDLKIGADNKMEPLGKVSYWSSNPAVLTVNERGEITGISAGQAQVTAIAVTGTSSFISEPLSIEVTGGSTAPAAGAIHVTAGKTLLDKGETTQMTAAPDGGVTWSVQGDAATIDADTGVLTAQKGGVVEVIATKDGTSGSALVAVRKILGEPSDKWTVQDDASNWSIDGEKDELTIRAERGSDWAGSTGTKSIFLTEPNSADGFTAVVKLHNKTTAHWEEAGLVFFKDHNNYVALERKHNGGDPKLAVTTEKNAQPGEDPRMNDISNDVLWLKLVKNGDTFTGYYSEDGQAWTEIRSVTNDALSGGKVGVIACNSENKTPFTFSHFTLDEDPVPFAAAAQSPGVQSAVVVANGSTAELSYGFIEVGNTGEGMSVIRWYASDSSTGAGRRLDGVTGKSLTLNESLVDQYVWAVVAPVDDKGRTGEPVVSPREKVVQLTYDEADATLRQLELGAALTPGLDPNTETYSAVIPGSVSELVVSAAPTNPGSTVKLMLDGTEASSPLALTKAAHTVTVGVTSPNNTTKTYTVNLRAAADSRARLASLSLPGLTFREDTNFYQLICDKTVSELPLSVTAAPGCTLTVRYRNKVLAENQSKVENRALPVTGGLNDLEIAVTAPDGRTKTLYRASLVKNASSDAALTTLKVNGIAVPGFAPDTTVYRQNVEGDTAQVQATAGSGGRVTLSVGGNPVTNGQVTLTGSLTEVLIRVTAEDGQTTRDYKLRLVKAQNDNAALLDVTLGNTGTAFDPNVTSYQLTVHQEQLRVTAAAMEETAAIRLTTGLQEARGIGSVTATLDWTEGKNTLTAAVTAPDGTTTKTYIWTITMERSVYLSDLNWQSATTGDSTWNGGMPAKDIAWEGKPMAVPNAAGGAETFAKGIGTHANSDIVYDLSGGDYKTLSAKIGVSYYKYNHNDEPKLIFIVTGDGRELYRSNEISSTTPYETINVPIEGVQTLTLQVKTNKGNVWSAHGNWADAKLLTGAEAPNRYAVTVRGRAWTDRRQAAQFDTVNIFLENGAAQDEVTVLKNSNNEAVTVSTVMEGKHYRFTMPDEAVIVKVESPAPAVNRYEVTPTELPSDGGEITVTLTGTDLTDGIQVKAADDITRTTTGTDKLQEVMLPLPANSGVQAVRYVIQYKLAGAEWTGDKTVIVKAPTVTPPNPTVNRYEVTPTVLPSDGGDITVTLTGTNLQNGIHVKAADDITRTTTGTGTAQTVTLKLPANTGNQPMTYTVQYSLDGNDWMGSKTVSVQAPTVTPPAPSGGGSNASVGRPSVRENAGQSQAAAERTHFIDVLRDSWYYSSVYSAHENGLIDGVGGRRFAPDATLTVAQAIKLSAALHQLDRTGEVSLKNGAGNWYDSYVSYAIANGILEERYAGYSREQMNAPVTRGEFVHIFHGALEYYEQINTVADNALPDVKLGDAFAAAIYELYRAGILQGNDTAGTFRPESTIKRSEAAAILNRMYDKTARKTVSLP